MREEIISDKEDHEDPVVDSEFQVEGEGDVRDIEFDCEVFPQTSDVEEDEGFRINGLRFLYYLEAGDLLLSCATSAAPASNTNAM
jgi:hypothetical protein